ncbi:MAG: hypothetical protein Q8941_02245 [Bacteroidota bacterium]|nr:hypothetical protein [Bacteroidota bacterium]
MKKVIAVLVICMTITSLSVNGQTWTGTISSDWNNNLNWSTGEVPTSNKTVIINNAAAPYQPVLSGDVNIASLTMSAGILGLNGYSLTCSGHATFTGDSLQNGKVAAGTFDNVTNMHMGGKVILEKTGASNEFWEGKNKFYGDSLIIVWRSGALHLENSALSPDSIFGNLKVLLANNYSVYFSLNSPLYIQNDLLLDNTGNGIFFLNGSNNTIIGGNLAAQNFSSSAPNLFFENVTTLGNSANGPFYSHTATVSHCHFNGNFTLVADSTITISIINSSFLGADNLLQAGGLWTHDNQFGRTGPGTTILRAAYNGTDGGVRLRGGNNKCFGNAQWETFALWPGGITIEHTYYGPDTTLGNLSFILTGNASLVTNANGSSYVGGNVIIDGQGAKKSVQFTGGTGTAFTIGGNFTAKNFTPFSVPGIGITNVLLRNVYANGIDTCGTFYCYSGDITNCSFKGNFRLIADSAASYDIANSSFLGTDNLFQALAFNAHDSRFGRLGTGTTILRAANKTTSAVYSRYGNNKYFGNAALETYAAWPGGVIMQQTFFGKDSCLGNLDYILKGNASLVTNESGNSYVGGNVVVDGQGARKWIQFTGGTGITFTIGGNFTVKDFTAFPEPGLTNTNVHLRNVYANGSDTCGTFYCYSGDITNCSFKGNFRLIADSAASYDIANSSFLGTDNLFQALAFNAHDSRFGQLGTGSTIFRAANKTTSAVYSRYGNNKYFGNATLETYAAWPGGVIIQQTFFGKDSCFGNLDYTLKGNASLVTNESGNSYVGGNVVVDGQGARKWIQFTGGTGITFTIGGNFTVKNFTASPEPGITNTNVHLRNVYANGSDTCGTFYCTAGDITNSVFNGNLKVIADSANLYYINNTSLLGADNFFRAANLDIQNSVFGKPGTTGTTVFTAAHTLTAVVFVREGNNKFLGNTQFDAYGLLPGGTTIQQTFYGKDTCFGNFAINLSGSSNAYLANGADLYIGKGLLLNNNSTTSGVIHNNAATAIHFIGNDTANYSSTGSGSAPSLLNIEMNRKGGLRLQSPLSCSGNLRFTRGMILSSLANPLIIPNGASVSMAWDSSYADGPVRKRVTLPLYFP